MTGANAVAKTAQVHREWSVLRGSRPRPGNPHRRSPRFPPGVRVRKTQSQTLRPHFDLTFTGDGKDVCFRKRATPIGGQSDSDSASQANSANASVRGFGARCRPSRMDMGYRSLHADFGRDDLASAPSSRVPSRRRPAGSVADALGILVVASEPDVGTLSVYDSTGVVA